MDNNNPATATPAQERVAKTVTTIVLIGTCVLGALGMSIAIVAMFNKEFDNSKDILQILFSAILPLFGTWIGTILAYYFSKENLLAANQTVRHLVDKITSDQKLETIKAKDVMIPIEKLFYVEYKTGADDKTLNLKNNFLDFLGLKGIQRVILLNENKNGKYVLHRSTIEGFIAEQYFNSPADGETTAPAGGGTTAPAGGETTAPAGGGTTAPAGGETTGQTDGGTTAPAGGGTTPQENGETTPSSPRALTFANMKANGNASVQAILKDGVKFIREDATLADAKLIIKNFSVCNDVFITKNGTANEPVLGWITDKTIAENSIV